MPKLASPDNTLLNGRIVLSQRERSSAWQARFKIGDRWVRVSTKQLDRTAAAKVAEDLYLEAQFKAKHDLPVVTRRFKPVAELAIKGMEAALAAGQGKKVYKDYIIAIKRYLIPFFGNHHINRIDYALLKQFEAWRIEKMGKQPKASSSCSAISGQREKPDASQKRGAPNAMHSVSQLGMLRARRSKTAAQTTRAESALSRRRAPHIMPRI